MSYRIKYTPIERWLQKLNTKEINELYSFIPSVIITKALFPYFNPVDITLLKLKCKLGEFK